MILKDGTGIDLSHWQKGVRIENLTPLPLFVIVKATEGSTYEDDTTVDFAAQTRALGLPLGFYHFWQNERASAQATNYLHQVTAAGGFGKIPPVLDLEVDLTGQTANVKTWLDVVERATGMRPILYGNRDIFNKLGNPSWFKNYDIWTASYPTYPDFFDWVPAAYSETRGRREIMWQYACTYLYPAYPKTKVDTNIAIAEFLNEIGISTPIPPTGGSMTEDKFFKVTTSSLNIRSSAQNLGSTNDLGTFNLTTNDVVHAVEVTVNGLSTYHRIDKIWRNGALLPFQPSPTGQYWSVEKESSFVYMVETTNPVPPTTGELPAFYEIVMYAKDANDTVLATYKGIVSKQ